MSFPSLKSLSLTAPTGARKKATPSRLSQPPAKSIAKKQPPPNHLDSLPVELRELVAHQLIALRKGEPLQICTEVDNWCVAHPEACLSPSVWREALSLAFGLVMEPDARAAVHASWRVVFEAACQNLAALSVEERQRWAGAAAWDQRDLDKQLMLLPDSVQNKPLRMLLIARGGEEGRYVLQRVASFDLMDQASEGDEAKVREKLALGAWPDFVPDNRQEPGRQSALSCAATNGHTEIVRILLQAGVGAALDAETQYNTGTPLLWALRRSHAEIAELLIKAGARVDTDILIEAIYGHGADSPKCVQLILKTGVDPDPNPNPSTRHTPRFLALRRIMNYERQLAQGEGTVQPLLNKARAVLAVIDESIDARRRLGRLRYQARYRGATSAA
tara:strand:+ start:21 stop:1187 length:1167 start_codon:yes stop_codon:yes gene_type:complete